MKAKLIKLTKIIGYVNVPEDTITIVVNDTRGHVNDTRGYVQDVYLYSEYDDAFLYTSSTWIGLDEIRKH